jgi:hypothetical protein
VRRLAFHLRALELSFEILAIDEDSGDNSVTLLGLLGQTDVPELALSTAVPGRGFAAAAAVARGRTLWLFDAGRADASLAPFSWAHERIVAGASDVVLVEGRYALARRTRAWKSLAGTRGRGDRFERRLERRALIAGLRVDSSAEERPSAAVTPDEHRWTAMPPAFTARAQLWGRVIGTYVTRR